MELVSADQLSQTLTRAQAAFEARDTGILREIQGSLSDLQGRVRRMQFLPGPIFNDKIDSLLKQIEDAHAAVFLHRVRLGCVWVVEEIETETLEQRIVFTSASEDRARTEAKRFDAAERSGAWTSYTVYPLPLDD
jgi:hypothetical protein